MDREISCDVVVIGAGAAGLAAGSALAASSDVLVLEAADRPGGRVESVRHGAYWLNIGAQFTEGTGPLFDVMDRYRIERGSLAGKKAALFLQGRMVTTDNPALLMLRSRMSLKTKVELARTGLRIKRAYARLVGADAEAARTTRTRLDDESGAALMKGASTPTMRAIFEAWSGQWIGCDSDETAGAQLALSIGTALEKASKVPNFALPVGGNQTFTDALAADLGDRLELGAEAESISWKDDTVVVRYRDAQGRVEVTARRAVMAVPADRALAVLQGPPTAHHDALGDIEYGRYVLAGVFTKESGPQRWDDYYAVSTPDLSFQIAFNHAASQRRGSPRLPGGALVLMAGGSRADELNRLSDAQIEATFLKDLVTLFPELDGNIDRVVVKRQPRVVSYWAPGKRAASQRTLRRPLGPIWFAGDYLGDPSLAAATESGQRAAEKVLASLGREPLVR
ncbi:flavin monoamine oxidase family protein [Nocardioides ginsengisoli]|uniref:flavin monoamine oxidase family protein n=1 Tax=Nocardioides ginsengisoli TaxID=363868 RepID=UPI00349E953A